MGETGEALRHIQDFVQSIDENIQGIAMGAGEQSRSIGEINAAVGSLERATQENANMVSITSEIAQSLSEGAIDLEELVNRFRLNRRRRIREPGSQAVRPGADASLHRGEGRLQAMEGQSPLAPRQPSTIRAG